MIGRQIQKLADQSQQTFPARKDYLRFFMPAIQIPLDDLLDFRNTLIQFKILLSDTPYTSWLWTQPVKDYINELKPEVKDCARDSIRWLIDILDVYASHRDSKWYVANTSEMIIQLNTIERVVYAHMVGIFLPPRVNETNDQRAHRISIVETLLSETRERIVSTHMVGGIFLPPRVNETNDQRAHRISLARGLFGLVFSRL